MEIKCGSVDSSVSLVSEVVTLVLSRVSCGSVCQHSLDPVLKLWSYHCWDTSSGKDSKQ